MGIRSSELGSLGNRYIAHIFALNKHNQLAHGHIEGNAVCHAPQLVPAEDGVAHFGELIQRLGRIRCFQEQLGRRVHHIRKRHTAADTQVHDVHVLAVFSQDFSQLLLRLVGAHFHTVSVVEGSAIGQHDQILFIRLGSHPAFVGPVDGLDGRAAQRTDHFAHHGGFLRSIDDQRIIHGIFGTAAAEGHAVHGVDLELITVIQHGRKDLHCVSRPTPGVITAAVVHRARIVKHDADDSLRFLFCRSFSRKAHSRQHGNKHERSQKQRKQSLLHRIPLFLPLFFVTAYNFTTIKYHVSAQKSTKRQRKMSDL